MIIFYFNIPFYALESHANKALSPVSIISSLVLNYSRIHSALLFTAQEEKRRHFYSCRGINYEYNRHVKSN
ncbi:hypothetical protein T11_17174 [Trichinella zimbabwensis]|uniref:Uncharacterized protein n=1 Tax=Trichinella zimbabwensis TaxID=268475 RepID=A0A0V1GVJ7_9BILA|nr:hypothetical protein T11_17174 [Trichinella zimbabwensis]